MDVYYMDISGRRTLVHCSRLDFRLRGVWVDEDNMFIKYENIIKVVCYDRKQRLRAETLNKEAGKWLQCYERVERCNGDCEHCEYDQDLSMFHFVSGYKRLLEEIMNGKDSGGIK